MNQLLKTVCAVVIMSVALPFCTALFLPAATYSEGAQGAGESTKAGIVATKEADPYDKNTVISLETGEGDVVKMNLYDYLTGVVAAEMPASFEPDALCAQAVAARSYTLYKAQNFSGMSTSDGGHDSGATVCADHTHCKAYITKEEMKSAWGDKFDTYYEKISSAVHETDGLILKSGGKTVNAVFHSTSSGRTQDAADVWGYDVDYLKSVASPGEELSPSYESTVTLSSEQFANAIKRDHVDAYIPDDYGLWVFPLSKTDGGYVLSADIFGLDLSGSYLRTLFSLKSSCFDISFDGEKVVFQVRGYGHGVGMSQYGANYLAQKGFSYNEILSWYYTDTTVERADL